MAYELQVNTAITGDNFAAAVASTDKLAEHTKKINDALLAYLATHDKLVKAQETEAGRQAVIAALKDKYWDQETAQLRKIAAAQDAAAKEAERRGNAEIKAADDAGAALRKLTAAHEAANKENQARNEQLGASIKNWIQNPLQAAGTAAEQFALQYGTIGVAAVGLSAGFAVAAAGAFNLAQRVAETGLEATQLSIRTGLSIENAQLFSRTAELAGVNAGALTTAMRTLSRGMSDNSEEGKKQREVLNQLGVQVYEVSTGALRSMDQILPEILQKLKELPNVADRNTAAITLLGRGGLELMPLVEAFSQLSEKVKESGVIITKDGVASTEKYRIAWSLVKLELEGVLNDLGLIAAKGIGAVLGSDRPSMRSSGMAQMVAEENAEGAAGGLFGQIAQRGRIDANDAAVRLAMTSSTDDTKDRLSVSKGQLKDLQSGLKLGVEERVNQPLFDKIAAKKDEIAAIEAEIKATKQLATEKEKEIELSKRSQEMYNQSFDSGEPTAQKKYDRTKIANAANRQDALRQPQANAASINASYDQQDSAAFVTYIEESGKKNAADLASLEKQSTEIAVRIGKDADKETEAFIKLADKTALKIGSSFIKAANSAREGALKVEEDSLKNLQDTGRKTLSQFGIRNQLAGGGEGAGIAGTYSLEISQAQAEYQQKLKIADLQKTEDERRAARVKADADLDQQIFDAKMQQENALLEIALRQKEAFQNTAVGFFNAAKSGTVPAFLKGQLGGLEDKVVGNAAGLAWKGISGMIPHADADSTLGKLLQGTPFGPDAAKAATVDNTAATIDNTRALRESGQSRSGGGGSAGGFGNSGFSDGGEGYGLPSGTNGDFGGEFGAPVGAGGIDSGAADGGYQYGPENYDKNGNYVGTGGGMSTAGKVGIGAAAIGAGYSAYEGFHAGGAQGALQGTASILGAASLIPGPQQPFIMAAAMATTVIASLLGDPKKNRENQISNELKYGQYMAPVAINASMTTGGTYSDFDRFGAPRGSGLSPFPQVMQGFFDYANGTTVPGRTNSQFGGPGGTPVTVLVQTLDSRSFNDNSHLVADAVQHALQTGKAPGLQETLRNL